jgi:hypothetical protein
VNSCRNCKHFHRAEESWEMPHIWWYECSYREGMANLKSFPFTNTKCKGFELYIRPRSGIMRLSDPDTNKGV